MDKGCGWMCALMWRQILDEPLSMLIASYVAAGRIGPGASSGWSRKACAHLFTPA